MLSKVGRRYLPPNCPGFTYTARVTTVGEEFGDMMEEEEEEEAYEPGEAEECPDGHALQELRTDAAGYRCDVCQEVFEPGTALHSCRCCNYDVCASCLPSIRGTYETAEKKADGSYEDPQQRKKPMAKSR
jgi:hypothetical protein